MSHPKHERTLVILKPDAVQRSLIGEIIARFERTGLKVVALKQCMAREEQCWEHYNKDEAWFLKKGTGVVEELTKQNIPVTKEAIEYGKDIIQQLVTFMTSGPVIPLVVEGNQSVAIIQKIVGSTEPMTSDVGTIRGDLTIDSYMLASVDQRAVRNLVHCSDQPTEAEREIKIWFTSEEILSYKLAQEQILYDVDFDGEKE